QSRIAFVDRFLLIEHDLCVATKVDPDSLASEVGEQSTSFGDAGTGVDGDRFPHTIDITGRDSVRGEQFGGQVCALDLEALLAETAAADAKVVHDGRGEEQHGIEVCVAGDVFVFGQQHSPQ